MMELKNDTMKYTDVYLFYLANLKLSGCSSDAHYALSLLLGFDKMPIPFMKTTFPVFHSVSCKMKDLTVREKEGEERRVQENSALSRLPCVVLVFFLRDKFGCGNF